jgi:hypothetical protein
VNKHWAAYHEVNGHAKANASSANADDSFCCSSAYTTEHKLSISFVTMRMCRQYLLLLHQFACVDGDIHT